MSLEEVRAELRRLREPSSKYTGVVRVGKRWHARIRVRGSTVELGAWDTELGAARAYDRGVLFYRGARAKRNFPADRPEPTSGADLRREARIVVDNGFSSCFRGVYAIGHRWGAVIHVFGRVRRLGSWGTERDAAVAFDRATLYYFSDDEHPLNFPEQADSHVPSPAKALQREARARFKQGTTSPYRGVSFHVGRYVAAITHGQMIYLGRWDTAEEAAHAYDKAARKLHGKNARLNFPDMGG